jgi:hypothetical protein
MRGFFLIKRQNLKWKRRPFWGYSWKRRNSRNYSPKTEEIQNSLFWLFLAEVKKFILFSLTAPPHHTRTTPTLPSFLLNFLPSYLPSYLPSFLLPLSATLQDNRVLPHFLFRFFNNHSKQSEWDKQKLVTRQSLPKMSKDTPSKAWSRFVEAWLRDQLRSTLSCYQL